MRRRPRDFACRARAAPDRAGLRRGPGLQPTRCRRDATAGKQHDIAGEVAELQTPHLAPDRPELLFEAGQLNVRLDKRRAAIAAFERFLVARDADGDPALRQRATALLQELRRGLN